MSEEGGYSTDPLSPPTFTRWDKDKMKMGCGCGLTTSTLPQKDEREREDQGKDARRRNRRRSAPVCAQVSIKADTTMPCSLQTFDKRSTSATASVGHDSDTPNDCSQAPRVAHAKNSVTPAHTWQIGQGSLPPPAQRVRCCDTALHRHDTDDTAPTVMTEWYIDMTLHRLSWDYYIDMTLHRLS